MNVLFVTYRVSTFAFAMRKTNISLAESIAATLSLKQYLFWQNVKVRFLAAKAAPISRNVR